MSTFLDCELLVDLFARKRYTRGVLRLNLNVKVGSAIGISSLFQATRPSGKAPKPLKNSKSTSLSQQLLLLKFFDQEGAAHEHKRHVNNRLRDHSGTWGILQCIGYCNLEQG